MTPINVKCCFVLLSLLKTASINILMFQLMETSEWVGKLAGGIGSPDWKDGQVDCTFTSLETLNTLLRCVTQHALCWSPTD